MIFSQKARIFRNKERSLKKNGGPVYQNKNLIKFASRYKTIISGISYKWWM
jgi:hypothetical protein